LHRNAIRSPHRRWIWAIYAALKPSAYRCNKVTIVERSKAYLVASVEIAFISILSRRLARLETQANAA